MNGRLKQLREALRMTQGAFGARVGASQSAIADYERGYREPSKPLVMTICREFSVSENWLRYGEGEMFAEETRDALGELLASYGLGDGERALVEMFLTLDPADRETVTRLAVKAADAIQKAEGVTPKTLAEIFNSAAGQADFEAGFDADGADAEEKT